MMTDLSTYLIALAVAHLAFLAVPTLPIILEDILSRNLSQVEAARVSCTIFVRSHVKRASFRDEPLRPHSEQDAIRSRTPLFRFISSLPSQIGHSGSRRGFLFFFKGFTGGGAGSLAGTTMGGGSSKGLPCGPSPFWVNRGGANPFAVDGA
jgi:hypothetical protein